MIKLANPHGTGGREWEGKWCVHDQGSWRVLDGGRLTHTQNPHTAHHPRPLAVTKILVLSQGQRRHQALEGAPRGERVVVLCRLLLLFLLTSTVAAATDTAQR